MIKGEMVEKAARAKHVATEGDWIIKGVQSEFYPCKPDIFSATYEKEPFPSQIPTNTRRLP